MCSGKLRTHSRPIYLSLILILILFIIDLVLAGWAALSALYALSVLLGYSGMEENRSYGVPLVDLCH